MARENDVRQKKWLKIKSCKKQKRKGERMKIIRK